MDSGTVLVITEMDMTADGVISELHDRGVPVARFDLADFPTAVSFAARYDGGGHFSGILKTPSRTVDLADVRSLYYRRPSAWKFPGLSTEDARFAREQAQYGFSGVLQALPKCLYVNHPRRSADAEWKPAQLQVAMRLGFDVPATVITNRLDEAVEFANANGPIVYKPVAQSSYKVDGKPLAFWVREVDPEKLDETIAGTAHMFQAKIQPKTADVRATVVGDKVFCVRIDSPFTDWRENYDLIEKYTVIDPPSGLPALLRSYLSHWGLVYGCFDFGIDSDGTWWFYECNPAGEWGWIEAESELPISKAFADILEKGST